MELVNNFNKGKRDFYDQELPTSDEQWQIAQRADPFTRQIIDKLNETPQSILPLDNKQYGEASTDYLYMQTGRILPGAMAPPTALLKRRTQRVKETSHERTVIKVTQEFVQMVVPKALRSKVMTMLLDNKGHLDEIERKQLCA